MAKVKTPNTAIRATGKANSKPQGRPKVAQPGPDGRFGRAAVGGGIGQSSDAPSKGTYETYRAMRNDPTVALARAIATAPIKSADWSVKADDGVPPEIVDFVQAQTDRIVPRLLVDGSRALDYGWQSWELVWDRVDNRLTVTRAKPLLPDLTDILTLETTGAFAGLRNQSVDLGVRESLIYTYDGEAGDLYGRSRHENIRENAWEPWQITRKKIVNYIEKVAGTTPMVEYQPGVSRTASGQEVSNDAIARQLVESLGRNQGIYMPKQVHQGMEALLEQGVDYDSIAAWSIKFIEAAGQHGADLQGIAAYFDALKLRGWLVPERAAIESKHGTKAEAASHADAAIAVAEETLWDMFGAFNRQVVDRLVSLNFGSNWTGKVRLEPGPVIDDDKAFLQDIIRQVLTNPANVDMLVTWLDIDAMLDSTGLPKAEETVDTTATPQTAQPIDTPKVVGKVMAEGTGDVVADQALNGAQVSALVEVVKEVTAKQLPPEAAKGILRIAFPTMPAAVIEKVINAVAAFKPVPVEEPARGPGFLSQLAALSHKRRRSGGR
jgi:hypothetical protein